MELGQPPYKAAGQMTGWRTQAFSLYRSSVLCWLSYLKFLRSFVSAEFPSFLLECVGWAAGLPTSLLLLGTAGEMGTAGCAQSTYRAARRANTHLPSGSQRARSPAEQGDSMKVSSSEQHSTVQYKPQHRCTEYQLISDDLLI